MSEIMEYHQITLDEYMSAKQEISKRLVGIGENFVVIGYLLRQIEATKAYEQDGYASLKEFAKAEYGMSESGVSRFMAINKKFSVEGNSKELLPEYQGYGYSKLQEMLTLTDEDCKLITESTTVAEIREIKKFEREEQKLEKAEQEENVEVVQAEVVSETVTNCHHLDESVTDCHALNELESPSHKIGGDMAKEGSDVTVYNWNDLQKVIIELFRDERERLTKIYGMSNIEDIVERINPSGNKTFRHKTYMLFMYGYSEGVILRQMGKSNIKYTWEDFIAAAVEVYSTTYTDPDSVWDNFYGVTSTKKENMHVSEEKKLEDKIEPQREKSSDTAFDPTKTIYNKADERVEPEVINEHTKQTPAAVEDELEGQLTIKDYPEALPEGFATSQEDVSVREKSTKTDILEDEKTKDIGRLTWNKPDGSWGLKYADIKELPKELYGVAYKLMKYERLDLSPEQIEGMLNEKHNTEE